MTPPLDRLSRLAHPRLTSLTLLGAGVGIVGLVLFLTPSPIGHGLGTAGLRLTLIGGFVSAFGASGLIAFAVFERRFD